MTGPPRAAAWLIAHMAARYSRDSLIGDLSEEYAEGRSDLWYWKQVCIAIGLASLKALHNAFWLPTMLWLLPRAAMTLWVAALVSLIHQSVRPVTCAETASPLLLVCLGILCMTVAMLCSRQREAREAQSSGLRRRLLLLAVTVVFSTATLTWAGTTTQSLRVASAAACRPIR